jgi:hypothetical protein
MVKLLFAGRPPKQVVKRAARTYWDGVGKYQDLYDELFQQLVPPDGKCSTVEGELLRAISKIYNDYYNNGFGNNWSGPWRFLETFAGKLDLSKELKILEPYAHGRMAKKNRSVEFALDSMVDKAIEYIQSKNGEFTPNTSDMWDLQEPDDLGEQNFLDDDGEDYGDTGEDHESTVRKILSASYKFKIRKADDLSWGENDKIEAYGVKGMKSTPWRKVFKNQKEFEKWLDRNEGNVEVHGTRKYLGAIGMPTASSDQPHSAEKRKAANWIYTIDLSRPWEVLDMLQEEDAPPESEIKAEFRNIADILDKVPDALRVPGRGLLNLHEDISRLIDSLRDLAESEDSSDELLEEGNRILQELYDWADSVKVWIKTTI